jgi:hypothetical protein
MRRGHENKNNNSRKIIMKMINKNSWEKGMKRTNNNSWERR